MITTEKMDIGYFYSVGNGHALVKVKVDKNIYIEAKDEDEINTGNCLLKLRYISIDNEKVGYYLYSYLNVKNGSGYLVCSISGKEGSAKSSLLSFRDENLILLDVSGCGAIAVSTKINQRMSNILDQ